MATVRMIAYEYEKIRGYNRDDDDDENTHNDYKFRIYTLGAHTINIRNDAIKYIHIG